MPIKMKRREILSLHKILMDLNRISSTKFAYAVARNLRIVKDEVESFGRAQRIELQDMYNEYDRKRMELVNKYASRDEKGRLVTSESGEVQMINYSEFHESLNPIKKEYAEAIKQNDEKAAEIEKMLDDEVIIEKEFYMIKASIIPDGIKPLELFHLMPLIEGEIKDGE